MRTCVTLILAADIRAGDVVVLGDASRQAPFPLTAERVIEKVTFADDGSVGIEVTGGEKMLCEPDLPLLTLAKPRYTPSQ